MRNEIVKGSYLVHNPTAIYDISYIKTSNIVRSAEYPAPTQEGEAFTTAGSPIVFGRQSSSDGVIFTAGPLQYAYEQSSNASDCYIYTAVPGMLSTNRGMITLYDNNDALNGRIYLNDCAAPPLIGFQFFQFIYRESDNTIRAVGPSIWAKYTSFSSGAEIIEGNGLANSVRLDAVSPVIYTSEGEIIVTKTSTKR